jgi:hypothetical protein
MKDKFVWAVYSGVYFRDRYQVDNLCEIPKYRTKKEALRQSNKSEGNSVFKLSTKKINEKCKGFAD